MNGVINGIQKADTQIGSDGMDLDEAMKIIRKRLCRYAILELEEAEAWVLICKTLNFEA
jgi:hypothetical protein